MKSKKSIFFCAIAIVMTMLFFSYQVVITFDSASYLMLSTQLFNPEAFQNWDVARGPIFPLIIRICSILFGKSTTGVLVVMYIFYIAMIYGAYLIYKNTIKNEKIPKNMIKYSIATAFFVLVIINPMIFGFYHVLLTEFVAITFAIFGSYLAWKWMEIDFVQNKAKYCLYSFIFAIMTTIAWLMKQPYVGTIFFPIIFAAFISIVRQCKVKNIIQRCSTILVCVIFLICGIKMWDTTIKKGNVKIREDRTSAGFFASGIINGIKAYDSEDIKLFNTIEKIESNSRLSDKDKSLMIDVLNGQSEYKSFRVVDEKKEQYYVIYTKDSIVSTGEALQYWSEKFKENPRVVLGGYITNYLATISVHPIEFEGVRIVIDKRIDMKECKEIDIIANRIYIYGDDMVFYLNDKYEPYAEEYHSINKPIVCSNWIMRKLITPEIVIMKIAYLMLPWLAIISTICIWLTKKKYSKTYCRIVDLIAILFDYSIVHILVHSMMGSTIDRYTIPVLATTYIGILLTIYAIIYRKKYKEKK